MSVVKYWVGVLILFCVHGMGYADNDIELRTHIAPPYQIKVDQVLTGESVESVRCVLAKINKKHTIKLMPWNRAIKEMKTELAHGYFAVARDENINLFATMSAPLILEKWSWYFKKQLHPNKQRDSFKNALIGVLSDSNEAIWLERRGYKVGIKARSLELLIKQLDHGRIDVILVSNTAFNRELVRQGKHNNYSTQFNKFTPLGIYFSNQFLNQNPRFLSEFNQAVAPCTSQQIRLTNQDRRLLLQLANSRLRAIAHHSEVISTLKAQNTKHRNFPLKQVLALDQQWLKELKKTDQPLIQSMLTNKLSHYLKGVKQQSNGLFSEIFVMDNKGLNVGQSDVTSDYWQGDESKYKNTVLVGHDAIFIDEIQFDASSQYFQSQVSLSITDPHTKKISGAITFGIDVEKALQQY